MPKFGERMGLRRAHDAFQIDDIDAPLRNSLWNCVYMFAPGGDQFDRWLYQLQLNFFKDPIDDLKLKYGRDYNLGELRQRFFALDWIGVYEFVEFLAESGLADAGFVDSCNTVLEREASAYRFVGGLLTRITSDQEIAEVEEAMDSADGGVSEHISRALAHLSDRVAPDYRNSIKESISAVEAACARVTGKPASLGQALKQLESAGVRIHPALKDAFSSIYGYSSDADGIRHALTEDAEPVLLEDAKYMLVSCSAFVNYLREKSPGA